ncbi:MAG: ATP-binding protein [Sideroxyarcus sp.]|nr:ATP-binding protein [Sideroxyarcus sp.]
MSHTEKIAKAFPAKRFFVDMLVRDIELQDAILDLLDNCVDGAMRSTQNGVANANRPYDGFSADIDFSHDHFSISDNCGGIPIALAEQYAFRMGRADLNRDSNIPTVGVYGIGMKRAIFKLGKNSVVKSQTEQGGFSVEITSTWLDSDDDWTLPLDEGPNILECPGTEITVTQLRDGIPRLFADETDFEHTLKTSISAYYGFIIEKGFTVRVNGEPITPVKVSLIVDEKKLASKAGISPYVYRGRIDDVDVSVTIGLYRPLPNESEEEEALQGRPSTEKAGWTIVCNDRVVLFADKTRVTGWGEATVPQYHTQFISIAGTVVFRSNDASKLPLTTTKRGIDGNSELYLSVKEFMREGLKLYTDFTNKWKRSSKELQDVNAQLATLSAESAHRIIPEDSWSNVRGVGGQKYKPNLPVPTEDDPLRQVRFSRKISDINAVAAYLFDDTGTPPSDVGAKCFDDILVKARS